MFAPCWPDISGTAPAMSDRYPAEVLLITT